MAIMRRAAPGWSRCENHARNKVKAHTTWRSISTKWRLKLAIPDDEETAALVAQITVAFQEVRRGDGVSLHETNILDDYGDEAARLAARRLDTDNHWWEIPDEAMHHHRFYFSYLDGQGLRYYLPAWMIHSLKHFGDPHDGRSNTLSDTLHVLTLSDRPDLKDWRREKWNILTIEQSQATCCYLRYVAEYHQDKFNVRNAVKGLRQHWGQFCGDGQAETALA